MPTQTREAIIQATIELFNEYGPMVPMAKISERAGVAAGTPFRYFPTKDALLHAAYIARAYAASFATGGYHQPRFRADRQIHHLYHHEVVGALPAGAGIHAQI